MSLASALSISLSGIKTTSTRLEVTADNIANASVEGFTKKEALLSSGTLGQAGSGVKVVGFARSTDQALFTSLSAATSDAGKLAVQDTYMQKALDLLGISSSDEPQITTVTTAFINAWTELSASPESSVSQQQVIQSGVNLANEIQRLAAGIEELDRDCINSIKSSISDLNGYLEQVQSLNEKISLLTTSNMSPTNLEDERDQIILKISELLDVQVMNRDNGQIALYTKGGYQLIDGASVASFVYNGTDIYETGNLTDSLSGTLVGGALEGLIDFRSTTSPTSTESGVSVIQKLRAQLDLLADCFLSVATTATSGEATFASAYNSASTTGDAVASQYLLSGAMRLTAVTAGISGNSISYTIDNGTNAGTYQITITDGTTIENIDNIDIGAGPYDWTNLINAINTLPSTLVTATAHSTFNLDPTTLNSGTLPAAYTLYGGTDENSPAELVSDFFTGTDRTNIEVNAALLNGTATVKSASAGDVVSALSDSTRVFSADGLNADGASYRTIVTSILATFQQDANNVSSLADTAVEQTAYLEEKLANKTGVNTDEEMVLLVTLQQAYTASARVMTVTNELFTILSNI